MSFAHGHDLGLGREHGWAYLNAIIDCCTREISAWGLDLRCRKQEALIVVEAGVDAHGVGADQLTLGTDNGTAYTSRGFRSRLKELEITHRRAGYRDPASQAFIESWFGGLKRREVWRNEYETLDDAHAGIGGYIERYHPPPPVPRLPHPEGGETDLGGCPGRHRSPTN